MLLSNKDDIFFERILSLLQDSEYNVLLNPHPSDRKHHPNRLEIKNFPILDSVDLYPVLQICSAVISSNSSIGLETAMARVPLILSDSYRTSDFQLPYLSEDCKIAVTMNPSNLYPTLNRIFLEEFKFNYDNFIKFCAYKNDGQSYKRVSTL